MEDNIMGQILYTAIALGLVLFIMGCQSQEFNCDDAESCTITVNDLTQDRGRQQTDAINPSVDARDNQVSGIPGV